ncbi:MAG: hypothetical protein NC828_05460, partial [Candidatus Omnitrophica bacterium]|nr:hypothetical protein [Candidatus Omnitrophota bacterium]
STTRSDNVTFGNIPLTGGGHTITFTVVGKNTSSTGYKFGVDCFSITPSGCQQEGEEATVNSDSGKLKINEDMTANGSWNGNRQLEYEADTVGTDFLTFDFYYDQWIETNFTTCLPTNTRIEYDNRTGDVTSTGEAEESGDDDYVVRLEGFGNSWSALTQTGALSKTVQSVNVGASGKAFRIVVLSQNIDVEGRAIKVRFDNNHTGAQPLTIDYADIRVRNNGPDADISIPTKQITFFDAGSSAPDGGTITIPAPPNPQPWVDSDWIDLGDIDNFNKNRDYLITFHVSSLVSPITMSGWTNGDGTEQSYNLDGGIAVAQDPMWSDNLPTQADIIYTAEFIKVSYFSDGTLTSQVYDTGMDDPAYSTLIWSIAKNNLGNFGLVPQGLGADLILRIRSDDDINTLLDPATSWDPTVNPQVVEVDTLSLSGQTNIASIGGGRYVQFQAVFMSRPTPGKADYIMTCVLKNICVRWLGQDRIVEVSGYFTRRPDYGIFSVKVDATTLKKGIELKAQISEKVSSEKTITASLTVEAEPRNTGK